MSGNAVTVTGQEQIAWFPTTQGESVQYDYRHTDGSLFSCCARSLEVALARRDEWLRARAERNGDAG